MAALYEALATAQGQFLPIEKNRDVTIQPRAGSPYSFRYADLEEVNRKTRPALSANGLSLSQVVRFVDGRGAVLLCMLMHKDGGHLVSELPLNALDGHSDPKAFGALLTYLRRYLACGMLGVAADDDLDQHAPDISSGASAVADPSGGKPLVTDPQARAAEVAAPAPTQPPAAGEAPADTTPCTTGEVAYIKRKLTSKGWTIAQACNAAGVPALSDIDKMTKGYFGVIKAVV